MVLHLKTVEEEQVEELAYKARNIDVRFVFQESTSAGEIDYELCPKPQPMSRFFPDKMKQHGINKDEKKMIALDALTNTSIKSCMPFTDAMRTGFGIPLWHDIFIKNETAFDQTALDNYTHVQTDDGLYSLSMHYKNQISDTTLNTQHLPNKISKLNNPWRIITPKGWSCLFVAPFSRDDIPIKCITGVVDTDTYTISAKFPFLIDKDFIGTVKLGTLVIQVIPFERVNSNLVYHYMTEEEFKDGKKAESQMRRRRKHFYRDNYRSKKR